MTKLELPIPIDDEVWKKAIAKAKTKWLQKYLQEILPQIIPLTDSEKDIPRAKDWDNKIRAFFDERGLSDLSQQKNRFTDIRNAIKAIDPQHPALNYIGLNPDEWIEVNAEASSNTDNRTTQLIQDPEAIVEKASSLLLSRQWSQVAAGLAVVTGRRVSEILQTAKFDKVSTYIVLFSGAAKRRDESVPLEFEIPTLVKADSVIEAIAYLRTQLNTKGLDNQQINQRYESQVSRECDRAFRDLVPTRDGKTNLYTHLFRSVYATIATHWYCPTHVSDLEFRAYIQGHFQIIDEPDQQRRLSLASSKHYWDYKISDGHGNVDGRLGIKLHEPEVEVVDFFTCSEAAPTENLGSLVSLKVWESDRDNLAHFQELFDMDNRQNTNHFILHTFSRLLDTAHELDLTPQQLLDRLSQRDDGNLLLPGLLEPRIQRDGEERDERESEPPLLKQEPSHHPEDSETNGRVQTLPQPQPSHAVPTALEEKIERQQQSMSDLTAAIHRLVDTLSSPQYISSPVSTATKPEPASVSSPKVSTTAEQTVPKESDLSPRQQYSKEKSQLVNLAIDRIIAFNNQPHRLHDDKWLITLNGLMRLAGCGQSIVYPVYHERQDEIDAHHQLHQLPSTHNKKDKSHPKIEQVIHLD